MILCRSNLSGRAGAIAFADHIHVGALSPPIAGCSMSNGSCAFLGAKRLLDKQCTSDTLWNRMPRKLFDQRKFIAIAAKAMQSGATRDERPHALTWDAAGNCTAPVYRVIEGAQDNHILATSIKAPSMIYRIEMLVRCRRCHACLKKRAAHWRMRANAEFQRHERCWFGTLTFKPVHQYTNLLTAMGTMASKDWAELSERDQFVKLDAAAYKHVQRYFKRLRKRGVKMRYLAVAEAHKTGLPHYHLLIHCDASVTWRQLQGWNMGFSKFNLADQQSVGYVTKYISKSLTSKLKSSSRYGL